ncbi:MAG: DUF4190 domain-containing protein [Acidobacteriota bacterium]|nr:DUF4190 domain-containing protein [Acidobacteriota bacterium]
MKICSVCNQTYANDEQNYCLNDGSVLTKFRDDEAPTVFMEPPRVTNQTNWQQTAPISPWQNQPMQSNQPIVNPALVQGKNQTLPTVSIILGVLSIVLICCYGGLPFGIGAIITGYLGLSNTNRDSLQFGGRGLAVAGLILGAISLFGSVLILIFAILGKIR